MVGSGVNISALGIAEEVIQSVISAFPGVICRVLAEITAVGGGVVDRTVG